MKKRIKLGITLSVIGALVALVLVVGIPLYHVLHGSGVLENHEERLHDPNNEKNLTALYTAIKSYHETEGQYPDAAKWMDQVKTRVRAGDMSKEEAEKVFVNPLIPGRTGAYGYAFNSALGGKYRGDIKDPKTLLVFDSSDTRWNANGDPSQLIPKKGAPGGREGVTVDGKIVQLP